MIPRLGSFLCNALVVVGLLILLSGCGCNWETGGDGPLGVRCVSDGSW